MLAVELKPDRDPWITKPVARRKKPSSSSLHALSMHLKMSMSEYKALPSQCLFCSLSLGKHTLSRFPNVWLKFDLQSSRLFKFYLTRKAQIKQVARHPVRNLWTLSSDLNKGIFSSQYDFCLWKHSLKAWTETVWHTRLWMLMTATWACDMFNAGALICLSI